MRIQRKEVIGDCTLYLGDCLEVLPIISDVDAVITDPPYGAEAHSRGRRVLTKGRGLGRSRRVDGAALPFAPLTEDAKSYLIEWCRERCNGWMLAFCQAEAVAGWRQAVTGEDMRWVRAMVWVKPDSSPQLSGDRPAQGYESIATAWCGTGRSKWNGGGRRGVFTFTKHDDGYGHGGKCNNHPTRKPIALMHELVSLFSDFGATVCDPFMGSGSTGVACVNLGRKFIGIERDPDYYDIACQRIADAYNQPRLFDDPYPVLEQEVLF